VTNERDERDTLEELLIGRALHALDEVEVDVAEDPAVLEYHDVLSYLPFDEMAPPRGLEARVMRAAHLARAPEVPSLVSARRRSRRIAVVGAAAAVAAVVSFVVIDDAGKTGRSAQIANVSAVRPRCAPLLAQTTDAEPVALEGENGDVARIALGADGRGAYCTSNLAEKPGYTYWLWVTDGSQAALVDQALPLDAGSGFTFSVKGSVTGASISLEPGSDRPARLTTIVASVKLD
jgi:hypothetical protein